LSGYKSLSVRFQLAWPWKKLDTGEQVGRFTPWGANGCTAATLKRESHVMGGYRKPIDLGFILSYTYYGKP
jgi:hypothetical protein